MDTTLMITKTIKYFHGKQELNGYLANISSDEAKPAVMIIHDWSGLNSFAREQAKMLAGLGYVGFAVDMYGNGRVGETVDEKIALMESVANDRQFLRDRILCAYNKVCELDEVDDKRVAAIGFCFGGMCVLDFARTGIDLACVVSFHGLLGKPDNIDTQKIKAKTLVLHGYDDPMATPDIVNEFCREMTAANADWEVNMYGNTVHGFTNPEANNIENGLMYNHKTKSRAFKAMQNFIDESFKN